MADEKSMVAEAEIIHPEHESVLDSLRDWMRTQFPWWAISFTVHTVALAALLLLGRFATSPAPSGDEVGFAEIDPAPASPEPIKTIVPLIQETPSKVIDAEITPVDPAVADLLAPPLMKDKDKDIPPGGETFGPIVIVGNSHPRSEGDPTFVPGSATVMKRPGPGPAGGPDTGGGGEGRPSRSPFANRTHILNTSGDSAVLAALSWLARHQSRDGNWSLQHYDKFCTDKSCTGTAGQESSSAATGLSLLCFLAAGQTHTVGKYKQQIYTGVYWLMSHQRPDGDLSAGAEQQMYSHGIAAIAMCEEYGMTHDKFVRDAAQKSINFIEAAQNTQSGGWRYHPGEEGDTSVLGWQLMALKKRGTRRLESKSRGACRHEEVAGRRIDAGSGRQHRRAGKRSVRLSTGRGAHAHDVVRRAVVQPVFARPPAGPGHRRRGAIPASELARAKCSQHLLLVLRQPGDAQHERQELGYLAAADAEDLSA